MGFLDHLCARLSGNEALVRDVWIGPYWTAVRTDGGTGLAATLLDPGPTHGEHAQRMAGAGTLAGRPARELVAGLFSDFPLARSVGLAALNASLPEPAGKTAERNAGDLAAEKGAGQTVGVVGWFPFIPQLRDAAAGVEVFEKDPETGFAMTAERAARLARCDGLCVTASALLNGTLDGILAAARPDAWKMLVGPSAPLCREALDLGFSAVCGARVVAAEPVVRVLREGGCFQQIRRSGGVRLLHLEA
ncbi:MAG: DUF364 domain-containing protein [Kiritimatiellia bacterium]